MKIFWTLIGIIALATIGVVVFDGSGTGQQSDAAVVSAAASAEPPSSPLGREPNEMKEAAPEQPAASEQQVDTFITTSDPEPVVAVVETEQPEQDRTAAAEPVVEIKAEPEIDTEIEAEPELEVPNTPLPAPPAATSPVGEVSFDDLLAMLPNSGASTATSVEPKSMPATTTAGAADPESVAPEPAGEEPAATEFALEGKGTKDAPYLIDWDVLTSARATYDPKNGKDEIPPAITSLDGKWVKLSGYTLFPLTNPQPRELLMMLNAWDGCCIGVPPSPYDAVEITLSAPVSDERFAQQGSVIGVLKVDPYLVGDWLIGLYTMSSASFELDG